MKKFIKVILYRVVGQPLYRLIRPFYIPSEEMRKRLRFIGSFAVETKEGKRFLLHNQAFHLETDIFWLGLEQYDWELQTRHLWAHLCRQAGVILDIGANTGVFALLAKVHNPEAVVVAFEPQPNVYRVLQKNNQLNHFDIRCENLALSDRDGELPFYNFGPDAFTSENTTAGSLNRNWRTENQSAIRVPVQKLEHYLRDKNLAPVHLIKIDVETHEPEVLQGYGPLLQVHQPIILLEIQDRAIGQALEKILAGLPYAYFHIDEQHGLRQVQGLGNSPGDLNYVLCPIEKVPELEPFMVLQKV